MRCKGLPFVNGCTTLFVSPGEPGTPHPTPEATVPAPRKITLASFDTTGPKKIEVRVIYSLGGRNWFNGNVEPRGYYLSAGPVEYDGMATISVMGTGMRRFIAESKRFSAKGMQTAIKVGTEMTDETVAMVCEREGLTLAPCCDTQVFPVVKGTCAGCAA
jgi:hypothetical protein